MTQDPLDPLGPTVPAELLQSGWLHETRNQPDASGRSRLLVGLVGLVCVAIVIAFLVKGTPLNG